MTDNIAISNLFFYAPAWERLRNQVGDGTSPLILERDGTLTRDGVKTMAQPGSVRAAWASPDAYADGRIDTFLDCALAARAEWVQAGSAGIDNLRFAKLHAAGIQLTTSDAMVPSIGELVMAGVLDHYQRGPDRRAAQAAHAWTMLPFREIEGSRWLVIGFGAIGREVARRARAFGANITGVRRSGGDDPAADRIIAPEVTAAALRDADVVVLCTPLSPATHHIANAAFFAAMKRGAAIVNVGRGGLLDEQALIAALDVGQLDKAILDVVSQEPLPPESPIWDHPKITLSCHVAGLGNGLTARSDALFLDNLARFRDGRLLRLLVDKSLFGAG